jgi:hypothetical protein
MKISISILAQSIKRAFEKLLIDRRVGHGKQ